MNDRQSAILKTLIYFEIFNHPLTGDELYGFLRIPLERKIFETELEKLIAEKLVIHEEGYYFLPGGQIRIADRLKKLEGAKKAHRIACFFSRIIASHPFVRGVLVSGSLSKNSFGKRDDIDYFVITAPGRLWVCRTLLMMFKKVLLLNSKRYFCINYYIDTHSLEIPDRNLFTATELAFLQPMQNATLYTGFMEANGWVKGYFPNRDFLPEECGNGRNPWLKKIAENFMGGKAGDRLDDRFMNVYRTRSMKKYRSNGDPLFELNFRSGKNVSKHHPDGYQEKTLQKYALLVERFEQSHGIDLSHTP